MKRLLAFSLIVLLLVPLISNAANFQDAAQSLKAFFNYLWSGTWNFFQAIGAFIFSIFQWFAGWLHNFLELPQTYESWSRG